MKKILFIGIFLVSIITFGQTFREFTPNKSGSESVFIIFTLNKDVPVRVSVIENGVSYIRNNLAIPRSFNKSFGVLQFLCDKKSKLQIMTDKCQIVNIVQQSTYSHKMMYDFGLLQGN